MMRLPCRDSIAKTFEVLQDCADFEVIVVNDGSHDDTGDLLSALALKYGQRMTAEK